MGHDPAKDFNDRLIAFMARDAEQTTTKAKPVPVKPLSVKAALFSREEKNSVGPV
jgi:hypothetical protein